MLSEEEIEKAKGWLSALDIKSEFEAISKEIILSYIEELKLQNQTLEVIHECDIDEIYQLETEKQKLIETLEKANKEDIEKVKYYEKMRRNTTSEFYKKSYQTIIHKLNAKRETRRNILKIMKGEK